MAQYTLCPFYLGNYESSITCEDVSRTFDSSSAKRDHMDVFCDAEWAKCPFAKALNEAYEKGDEAVAELKKQSEKDELRSLTTRLGRAKKKIEKLNAICKSYTNEISDLKAQKRRYYNMYRDVQEKLDRGNDAVIEELNKLGVIYEQRMCYLIDRFAPDGIMVESDVEEWAKDKEFALVHDMDENGRYWMVVFKEEDEEGEETDDAHEPGRVQGDAKIFRKDEAEVQQ